MNFSWHKLKLFTPFVCISLATVGSSMLTTHMGASSAFASRDIAYLGCIHAAYYAGMLLGSISLQAILRKITVSRTFVGFTLISILSVILQAYFVNFYVWLVTRFVFGLCFGIFYIIIESWLIVDCKLEKRGRILAIYWMLVYAAQFAGQSLLMLKYFVWVSPYAVCTILSIMSAIPFLFVKDNILRQEQQANIKYKFIFNASFAGVYGCLISGLIISTVYTLTPNFACKYNYSAPLIMQSTILGGYIFQWPLAKISDHYGRSFVYSIAGAMMLSSALLMFIYSKTALLVYICSGVLGGGCFSLYTASILMVCDKIHIADTAIANSALLVIYGVGSVIGPILAASAMEYWGPQYLYVYMAVIAGSGLLSMIKPCLRYAPSRVV